MRKTLATMIAMLAWPPLAARAIEVRGEATVGHDFAYVASNVATELVDGQLGIGGGLIMVSDFINERYGAAGVIEYHGDNVSTGLEASFGPRQFARGWATLDPHAELHFTTHDWTLHGQGGVLLRRIDATSRHE